MVRAALSSKQRIGKGPVRFAAIIPAASVVLAAMLTALPIVSSTGWYPDFGFLAFLSWRLLRSDPWPAWWAAPLGLANDLITGGPIGLSVALWSAVTLAMDLIDRRTQWRDYWIEWGVAALFLAINQWLQWRLAKLGQADLPLTTIVPPLVISICAFPLAAWIVSRIDVWRLGR